MDEIRRTLDAMNLTWRERRFEDLATFFDEQIVMLGPGLVELLRGREALVRSYADFMTKSVITEYTESGHAISQWGTTAVARFDWSMTWTQNGKTDQGSGQDMFVFQQQETGWIAVMRVMLY